MRVEAGKDFVLSQLLACERGLLRAYQKYARTPETESILDRGIDLHAAHVQWLTDALTRRVESLGIEVDDSWLFDDGTLLAAEVGSHGTWHDALADLSPDDARYVRERLLPDHHELLRRWEDLIELPEEPSVNY